MSRRSGFTGLLTAVAREAARQQRVAAAAQRLAARNAAAWEREATRAQAAVDKNARKTYLEARAAAVDALNSNLAAQLGELRGILAQTLRVDDTIAFSSLRITEEYPAFAPPHDLTRAALRPCREAIMGRIHAPGGLAGLIPGAKRRYLEELQRAEERFNAEESRWQIEDRERMARLGAAQAEHEANRAAFEQKKEQRNNEVAELERAYREGDPEAVVSYNTMVLERSQYPDDFPQEFRLAYVPESKQLVVEYELPPATVVPAVSVFSYLKSKDAIKDASRKPIETREIYQDVVAAVCLRTIHELLEADQGRHVDVVCFNGFLQTVDPATGRDVRPHLISLQTTREAFGRVDLSRVDKLVCLRNLGAQVSPRSFEAQPIRPVVDFDMVDKRFVEQSDVLADLESRPNLMDLNPFEFENLVANLFTQMGLDSKLTRSSRDGGVDCVAFDPRPVLGGKVVIQAKRYTSTVGVSAVRDLYGTMMNEGANKGILVTTSGYGPDAYQFCKDKPIELIDGGGLLYLLQQVGIAARIVFLDDGSPTKP
jgi:restriction system protein